MHNPQINQRRQLSKRRMREVAKHSAPGWLVSVVHLFKKLRSRTQRRLGRIPGFHPIWILFQRLRFKLIPPRTLNQKIRYRMSHDRREILQITTDKLMVREHVEKRVGSEHLTTLYGAFESADDIIFEQLPRNYVMKATHASGATLIVDERAPVDSDLPAWNEMDPFPLFARIHPDGVGEPEIRQLAATWLRTAYGRTGMRPQWAYQELTPRVLFEELLDDGEGNVPPDYKIFCFNGHATVVQVITERGHEYERFFYTPNWQPLPDIGTAASSPIRKPICLPEMLSLAQDLAEEFDFVRVDLYEIEDRVLVGELTHYPAGGNVIGGGRGPLTSAALQWSPMSVA